MKNLLKTLILAAALTYMGPVVGHADVVCKATEDQFYKEAAVFKPRILVANDNARTQIVTLINEARTTNGLPPFIVDKLIIGIFDYKGQVLVGTAMFKNGCLVEGSVKSFPLDQFVQFIESIGLGVEDFKLQVGA